MKYMNLSRESRKVLLEGLEGMPDFLAATFSDLPAALHDSPGPDGSFSPVEQAWHLADLEEMGFAARIRRLRSEAHPRLPDFMGDVVARERNYKSLSLREGIAAFRQARSRNLATLKGLRKAEWTRGGTQDGFGPVSLCDLPSMMTEHDESHRREIEAWLEQVRH